MKIKPTFVEVGGAELVILTRADYEALMSIANEAAEDAADVAIYDKAKAALARGEISLLPAEVSARVLKGDSLIKAVRKWRGLTQNEVADRASVAQGYLSDIEAGRRIGRVETLTRIAGVLDVPAAWLRPPDE